MGENMEFWNLAASGELMLALQNGFGGNLHYVTPPRPQLSLLFVTVHTNAIVVTMRISIADLIGCHHHYV